MSYRIAHFSDPHLGPLALSDALRNFALKRLIGSVSWHANRKRYCHTEVAEALRASICAEAPDHMICGGDLVNIAAYDEFPRAAQFLASFGKPENLSFVPGNHDSYVAVPEEQGMKHFEPWYAADMRQETATFPSLRLRRNIAIIGLSSSQPQSLFSARGTLGERQIETLRQMLLTLKTQGFCRVINIHHPPLPGLAPDRKALTDAAALRNVLEQTGAELVLHGHNHKTMKHALDTANGSIPVIGVPAASSTGIGKHEPAAWHLFTIDRRNREWMITMTPFKLQTGTLNFMRGKDFLLPSAAAVRQNNIA